VSTNSPCLRCSQPIALESDSGLCPVCLASDPEFRPASTPNQPTTSPHGTAGRAALDSLPNTRVFPGEASESVAPAAPPGYELLHRLGGGGMGEVHLAREYATSRLVAMKFLRHPADRAAFDRFLVELRALARVEHAGVVRVFAADFLRSDPFFTMEYVPGGSLGAKLVSDGPLDPREAARLLAAAARAVHAAHETGVIHRDLKPGNILLSEDGTPKVSDFGLAKRTDRDDGLTTTSGPVGTPSYMAPEQASRHYGPPGPRADVYGLGATLYHLLTGRPPFSGSPAEVVTRVLTTVPARPRAIRPEIPVGLEAVVMKCLEKPPGERYPTAAALADDLERFLAGRPTEAPALTWRRRAWRTLRPRLVPVAVIAVLLIGVFLLGAAVWPASKPARIDPVETARKELAAGRPVTLIDATGGPKHARWLLDTNTIGPSPHGDESCHFVAMGYSLLELFPAPGINKYRIDLELRHLQSPNADPRNPIETDFFGVYWGYEAAPLRDGLASHKMFAVIYRDADYEAQLNGIPPRPQPIGLYRFQIDQRPDARPTPPFLHQVESILATPTPRRPGAWRPLRIECTPERMTVMWRDDAGKLVPLAEWDRNRLSAEATALKTGALAAVKGAEGGWEPNAPFGLIAYKASLSVRNVVVTPLQ
jgi:hypothetical protein